MRRRIGVTMVREQARLKFDRIEIMLNGNRSHAAAQFHGQQNMQQDQEDYYNRHGPQGFADSYTPKPPWNRVSSPPAWRRFIHMKYRFRPAL